MARTLFALLVALVPLGVWAPRLAAAQPATPTGSLPELVDTDPTSDDPIGVDVQTDLSRVPGPPRPPELTSEELAARGPIPPRVEPMHGEVLSAASGVEEREHLVDATLEPGLASVVETIRLGNHSRHPVEAHYRLAVPERATIASLEVCRGDVCRRGIPDATFASMRAYDDAIRSRGGDGAPPVGLAALVDDARGHAIALRVAPIPLDGELVVRVGWMAAPRYHGGVARLELPARGQDPRAATQRIRVRSDALLGAAVDGTLADERIEVSPMFSASLSGRARVGAPASAEVLRFACGARRRCARVVVSAGPRDARPLDLVLAIDASPSTEGPARGRIAPVLAALLASAPSGSRVRALAFGAEAATVLDEARDVADVPLVPLARAVERELGSATRFEALWASAARFTPVAGRRRVIVVVGDGGLTESDEGRAAFAEAARARVEVSAVVLGDRAPARDLADGVAETGGVIVDAGADAEEAARGRGVDRLEERVAEVLAPLASSGVTLDVGGRRVALGALRAGERVSFEGALPRRDARVLASGASGGTRVRAASPDETIALGARAEGAHVALAALDAADVALAARGAGARACDAPAPPRAPSGVSSDAYPIALAGPAWCAAPPSPPPAATVSTRGHGIPAETVLAMLRQRVRPVARGCFRRDRAGRGDYATRAEFVVHLADREVVRADVRGQITDELRGCLLHAVESLDVPRYDGRVIVRYPLVTERIPPPPVIELDPDVAREVDRVIPEE